MNDNQCQCCGLEYNRRKGHKCSESLPDGVRGFRYDCPFTGFFTLLTVWIIQHIPLKRRVTETALKKDGSTYIYKQYDVWTKARII